MTHKLAFIFLLFISVLFSGCNDPKTYRIGVSQCSSDDWRNKMNDEIQREAMLHPEVSVEIRSAECQNDKQIDDIRYFQNNNFDIIIAAPNEADAITPIIKDVYESGTPVIIFDRDIQGASYTAKVGVDNVEIGRAAAFYARHLANENAKVIELYGLKGSSPAVDRSRGFDNEAEKQGLVIAASAYGNWTEEEAMHVTDSLFNIHKDIDIIFAHNDRMAIGASKVAHRRGIDVSVIGVDAVPEIGIKAVKNGVIDATFLYPTEGDLLIRTALNILKGHKFKRDALLQMALPVDKTNATILLVQNDYLSAETDKVITLKSQIDQFWVEHSAQKTLFYASLVILALLSGFIFMLMRAFWSHKRHQQQLLKQNSLLEEQRDNQKVLNEQLREATQSKLAFFTNVSHDLRTPLTLISEPIELLSKADNLTESQQSLVKMANKNVRSLRHLIDEILDFQKIENGKLTLSLKEVYPAQDSDERAQMFMALARKRHIKFIVDDQIPKDFSYAVDPEKMERIFYNILSNAFKFTPDNGTITVVSKIEGDCLVGSVEDSGKGISPEDQRKIFDRFYQVDKVNPNGSGIGLALVKAFTELHGGKLVVESELGKGSKFTVIIPIRHVENKQSTAEGISEQFENIKAELEDIEIPTMANENGGDGKDGDGKGGDDNDDKPLLLIIDDNTDIRKMVSLLLQNDYKIMEAANGKDGIRLASKYTPDLIICDVMMPVMNGFECCRLIKNEVTTSHIPVLMLTACSLDEQRSQGYECGVDGYLCKPFTNETLKIRCANLIANRRRIKNLYATVDDTQPNTISSAEVKPADEALDNEFYNRFLEIVHNEMDNPELCIDDIVSQIGIGRSQFYRKIKVLTNYSPVELLRNIRLKQARELLVKTDKSISEIAYNVGFTAPAYFTRCYKEFFGEKPSDIRDRLGH